jgi:hypothetical protein
MEARVSGSLARGVHLSQCAKAQWSKEERFIRADNYRTRVLAKLATELGLPKLNFQVLRRTVATLAQTTIMQYTQRPSKHTNLPDVWWARGH